MMIKARMSLRSRNGLENVNPTFTESVNATQNRHTALPADMSLRRFRTVASLVSAAVVLASVLSTAPAVARDAEVGRWGQKNVSITSLSDAFRYSPSSRFAPGDGGVSLDWVDENDLEVVKVTNLKNQGEGSLRWALEQKTGPRFVVFEVGGVIDLEGKILKIKKGHGNVIVAGQTAPPPGITIIRDALRIHAPNVIVQHIRVRPGDDIISSTDNYTAGVDSLQPGGSYDEGGNQIIDHCSVTWSSDETLSVSETSGNTDQSGKRDPSLYYKHDLGPGKRPAVTVSNTIIADALRYSDLHDEKQHNLGTLLYRGFEHYFMGNLIANVESRTPWIGAYGGCDAVVVNNLLHNIGHQYKTVMIEANGKMRAAIIGNAFSLKSKEYHLDVVRGDDVKPKDIYMNDNDNAGVRGKNAWNFVDTPPISMHKIKPLSHKDVLNHHVQTVGARPAERTPLDERNIQQLKRGKGKYIDSQEDVGGYPDLMRTYRPLKVPSDPAERGRWLLKHTAAVELPSVEPPAKKRPIASVKNLQIRPASTTSIVLNWKYHADTEALMPAEGFKIERAKGESDDFQKVVKLKKDARSFTDNGLDAGTQYYYRVKAYQYTMDALPAEVDTFTFRSSLHFKEEGCDKWQKGFSLRRVDCTNGALTLARSAVFYNSGEEKYAFKPGTANGNGEYANQEDCLRLQAQAPENGEQTLITEQKIDFTNITEIFVDWENRGSHETQIVQYIGIADEPSAIQRASAFQVFLGFKHLAVVFLHILMIHLFGHFVSPVSSDCCLSCEHSHIDDALALWIR